MDSDKSKGSLTARMAYENGTTKDMGRRLAAIMFTDLVGYSSLSSRDENLAMELLNEHREIVRRTIALHHGQEIKSIGDGFLIEFASIVEAVNCAVAIQTALFERNLSAQEDKKLQIRIGLHLGDVVDFEEDRYGNEVNIAARIEPFAGPGGICVSQQVVDQVSSKIDFTIFKLGRIRLKNIAKPVAVYRILLPWESRPDFFSNLFSGIWKRFFRTGFAPRIPSVTPEGTLLGIQVAGILILLAFVFTQLLHPVAYKVDRGPTRSIASLSADVGNANAGSGKKELILPSDWLYAHGTVAQQETTWHSFDPSKTIQYANELEGSYLLKLSFIGEGGFRHPAMVLGLIPDVYRVYLNGKFIGGSERFSNLAMYSFDPSLIKPGETNTILIKAWSRRTLSPGLNILTEIQPRIGEFEDISSEVSSSRISFLVFRPIYLAISLLIAMAGLFYYLGQHLFRRGDLKYLYFSGFLLLGSLALAYYNPFIANALDYSSYRYVKLVALGLSSFFLFSSYLHLRGLRRLETANNAAGIAFCAVAALLLLRGGILPTKYIASFNVMAEAVVAYSALWLGLLALRAVLKISKPVELRSFSVAQAFDAGLVFSFGVVIALFCYSSIIEGGGIATSVEMAAFRNVAIAYPFVFAVMVLATGLGDYLRKSRSFTYKKRKDDLVLSIADLVSRCPDVVQAVGQIQEKLAEFLNASRSTIYLATSADGGAFLKASFVHGPVGIRERVEKVIPPRSGIIGYCMDTRSAVFVEDIAKDPRFRGLKKDESSKNYRTGSFMVFPLILGSRLLGVITVADRLDNRPFTRDDFCLMHLLSKDLAFVISHSHLAGGIESAGPAGTSLVS